MVELHEIIILTEKIEVQVLLENYMLFEEVEQVGHSENNEPTDDDEVRVEVITEACDYDRQIMKLETDEHFILMETQVEQDGHEDNEEV